MWRKALTRIAAAGLAAIPASGPAGAADVLTVRTLVPRLAGPQNLSASVSRILALRLWTTLRPRSASPSDDRYFGVGEVRWSNRVIDQLPEDAVRALHETGTQMVLWGNVEEYGDGIVAATNVVIEPHLPGAGATPRLWTLSHGPSSLELDLPSLMYQFSPLILGRALVARYSRPDQIRICAAKAAECDGAPLRHPFRAIRQEGDYALVRQYDGRIGWVYLPDLSSAEGEIVGTVAGLIAYLRGDFEQAQAYFTRVSVSKAESLVRNDARLLAAVSAFRRSGAIEPLRAAQASNPYSRFGAQALIMAEISLAMQASGEAGRRDHAASAAGLVESYRILFAPADPWPRIADEILRRLR